MSLELSNVTKYFGHTKALDDVSISIETGSLVCFLGPSGCGKTTLLRVIAGLESHDSGSLRLDGNDLSPVPARNRNFGVVFQSYSLFPNLTVAANIAYGLECRKWTKKDTALRVGEMLELIQLRDHAAKYPHQLSGGQQQRIALARALAPNPSALLLDEPLSALDAKVREELRGEIRSLQQRLGITTIMVTHDQEEALTMADSVVVMQNGKVMQKGSPMELYRKPQNRFVAEFIGQMNIMPANIGLSAMLSGTPAGSAAEPAAKQPLLVGIRPEDVRLAPRNGAPHLAAVVDRVVHLGNLTRVSLRLPAEHDRHIGAVGQVHGMTAPATDADGMCIVAELQGVHEGLHAGMPQAVTFAPESVHVLEWQ
ncbi:ABC transporter ATP-binding protein [Desulfovibrio psychrotolerans]|uniref:ABC transporter ATP-binding protein n=1 Tax=Desulfovibrio psychrotolerans TaxID=415242 RepID=A0A7J0BT67_9BACT|nr:ATP-binding cassette domain-containing protein [Desulfovibrio psychrotolerans]GFM36325.1 ABC transporter ATP-binding protein [Desulfovibrio psychrotolerans]